MATITITFPDETGANKTFTVEYADEFKGSLVGRLAQNRGFRPRVPNVDFRPALPEDPVTNPREVANPRSMAQFVAQAVVDTLVQEALGAEIAQRVAQAANGIRQEVIASLKVAVKEA